MNYFETFRSYIIAACEKHFLGISLDLTRMTVEPPKQAEHGDFSTNIALLLSKPLKKAPQKIASDLLPLFENFEGVQSVKIAGPGFINFRLKDDFWITHLKGIISAGKAYGRNEMGGGDVINLEYVSANPTGPLTAAHARGAIFGDALGNLLAFSGYKITREYYINDAGGQVDTLARSTYLRYKQAAGIEIDAIPEGYYPGDYLKAVGTTIFKFDKKKWLDSEERDWLPYFKEKAVAEMMVSIRGDLEALGVHMDYFASEKALVASGAVQEAFDLLSKKGLIYQGTLPPPKGKIDPDWEAREQTLFKSSNFGDDQDRPLKKSDGSWTYFANDIAYHYDKYKRFQANELIDVLGADHGGYVKRMKAATAALTDQRCLLDVKICQLVHLLNDGKLIKMSKRSGQFITLREVLDKVGRDVMRFIMLTRSNDQTLEFDFKKVTEFSKENPVFYVQYAHARSASVFRHAARLGLDYDVRGDLNILKHADFLAMIKKLSEFPRAVQTAALAHEPHRIAFYLYDLASVFHGLWHKGNDHSILRFLAEDQQNETSARLVLLKAVMIVVSSALELLGVTAVDEM